MTSIPTTIEIKLIKTDEYPVADNHIAGNNYNKYDDVLYHFLINIVALYPHLMISYPYVFTTNHNLSWLKSIDINKNINLAYKPFEPTTFYMYNEIYQLFLATTKSCKKVLCVGLSYGLRITSI